MPRNDLLKRYLDAGLAFTAMTQARAESIVKSLVAAGELQRDQAQVAVEELVERSRSNTEKLLETVRREVRTQLAAYGVGTKHEITRLQGRFDAIAKKPAAKKAAKKPAAKKAAKKPAAKKAAKRPAAKKAAKKPAAKKRPATRK